MIDDSSWWFAALAAVGDGRWVQGGGRTEEAYAGLWLAFLASGLVGCAMLAVATSVPRHAGRWIAAAGTAAVALQYVLLSGDLLQYPAFAWYDGLLLVPYTLLSPHTYRDPGTFAALAMPAAGILAGTVFVPLTWLRLHRQAPGSAALPDAPGADRAAQARQATPGPSDGDPAPAPAAMPPSSPPPDG
jgi:hypothetical protein